MLSDDGMYCDSCELIFLASAVSKDIQEAPTF